ncbi:hypothetical protein SUDANB178_06786 [Streptomyces sp. enrichment culture]
MTEGADRGENALYGPQPGVSGAAGCPDAPPRAAFFTDTSVASAVRRARWRARSGTRSRRTAWN